MKVSDSSAEGKFNKYICMTCGFIYDETTGDPSSDIAPGTRFEDLSEEWVCSMCGDPKSEFRLMTDEDEAASKPTDPGMQGDTTQIIVIGSGIAGWAAIEELRKSGYQGRITLVTQGRADYYYKPALSASSSKGLSSTDLVMHSAASKSTALGVTLVENIRVIGIERAKRKIITDNGLFAYDHLIVATGSNARIPALFRVNNVYSINSLNDYEKLHSKLPEVRNLAIIGGGLIGCEMADDLSKAGVKITVINRARHLLEGLVPEPLAQGLQNALASKGVVIRNNEEITELDEKGGGTLQLGLASGDSLEVEALLLCTGTVASYRFCQLAGIESGAHGIVVDNHMRTSDPSIYALGDCVECEGQSLKFVEPIINQAKVIAHHLTSDDASIHYQPERILIKVKTPSYPICVYKHRLATPVKTWKLINSDEDGIFAELFCDNDNIGCALSGKYVKEMQADLKTSYITRNN